MTYLLRRNGLSEVNFSFFNDKILFSFFMIKQRYCEENEH